MIIKRSFFRVKTYRFGEILLHQNSKDGFNRLDIIVRLLAIENEVGLNECGWDLYEKMQMIRNNDSKDEIRERVERFKNLIYGRVEYSSIPIVLDSNYHLYDGSHRMALGIFNDIQKTKCLIDDGLGCINVDYGLDWFYKHSFTESEVKVINDRLSEVLYRYSFARGL